jgi:hypothetical protein
MDSSGMGWQEAVVAATAIAFFLGGIAVVLVYVMKVGQSAVPSDASKEQTMMARSLAEEATVTQRTIAGEITELRLAMVEIRDRLSSIERMMTEVG